MKLRPKEIESRTVQTLAMASAWERDLALRGNTPSAEDQYIFNVSQTYKIPGSRQLLGKRGNLVNFDYVWNAWSVGKRKGASVGGIDLIQSFVQMGYKAKKPDVNYCVYSCFDILVIVNIFQILLLPTLDAIVTGPDLVRGPHASIILSMTPQPCPHSRNHSASPWPSRVTWFDRITFAPHNVCVSGTMGWICNSLEEVLCVSFICVIRGRSVHTIRFQGLS